MEKFEQSEQFNIENRETLDQIKEAREKEELKARKVWIEIMMQNIAEFPEDIQKILKRRTTMSDEEGSKLDKARDEFWKDKFGVNFTRELGRKRRKKIKKKNVVDAPVVYERSKKAILKSWLNEDINKRIKNFNLEGDMVLRSRDEKRTIVIGEIIEELNELKARGETIIRRGKFEINIDDFIDLAMRKIDKEAKKQISYERTEQNKKRLEEGLEKLKKLNVVLKIMSEKLKMENAPVENDCRIDMNYFKILYKDEDIVADKKKIGYAKHMNRFRGDVSVAAEKLEIIKTIIFNKMLGDKFVIVRSSLYDDAFNGADNVVIEKETGNLVCMLDEVSVGSSSETERIASIARKWKKVIKINNGGGAKLKYGLGLEKNDETGELSFEPATIDNIPIFALILNAEDTLKLEKEIISYPLDEVSNYEKKMFRYLIASVIPQMQLLESEELKPELREKIEQFKKVIERI